MSVADPLALPAETLAEWESLWRDSERPNPYFAPWFLKPAMEWLDPENTVRLILITDRTNGTLAGLIPVVAGSRYARLPLKHVSVWKPDHLYNGTPLVRLGYAKPAMDALIDWIGTCPMGIRFLRFTQLAADGPVYHAITAACSQHNRELFPQLRLARPALRQGRDDQALIEASQSTKHRAEMRRRFRRFAETGTVDLSEHTLTTATAPALIEAFLKLENSGWKKTAPSGTALAKTEAEQRFFTDMMMAAAAGGHAAATILSRDAEPVALSFSLRDQDMQFGYKTAFDRSLAKFSPGVQVFQETTRRMLGTPDISLYDSCAMPGHPILDGLWPDRLDYIQTIVPARGAHNTHLVRIGANAEALRERFFPTRAMAANATPPP